jgi:hypothetical protein
MEQTLAAIRRLQKNEQPLNFVRSRPLRRFRLHGCIKRRGPEKKLNGCEEANRQLLNPPRFARSEDNIIAPSDFEQKPLQERNRRFDTRTEKAYGKLTAFGSACKHSEVESSDRSER